MRDPRDVAKELQRGVVGYIKPQARARVEEKEEKEEKEEFVEVRREQRYFEVMGGIQANRLAQLDLGNVYGLAYDGAGLTLTGHSNYVCALTVLPDGCIVSGSQDNLIKIWKKTDSSYSCIQTLSGHSNPVHALTVLPDDSIVSGSEDNTIKIWRKTNGSYACVQTLSGHSKYVYALTILPDGFILSGSTDNTIKIWRITGGSYTCVQTLSGHSSHVWVLSVLPDGCIVSGSADNTIKVWRAVGGSYACVQTLSGHVSQVHGTVILSDGCIVSGSHDNTIKLWKATGGSYTCVQTLTGHSSHVHALTILPDGSIASGSEDNTIKIWKATGGSYICVQTLIGYSGRTYTSLSVLPDGSIVSSSADNTIKIWNSNHRPCNEQEYIELLQAAQHSTSVQTLLLPRMTFSKKIAEAMCQLIVNSKSIIKLDLSKVTFTSESFKATVAVIKRNNYLQDVQLPTLDYMYGWNKDVAPMVLSGHTQRVYSIVMLPNGDIVSGSDNIKIWRRVNNSYICMHTLSGHTSAVTSLVELPDGSIVSGSQDKTIKIWEYKDGAYNCKMTLDNTINIWSLAILPDGNIISTANRQIKIWKYEDSKYSCIRTLMETNENDVLVLVVLPDGRLVTGNENYTIKLWEYKDENLNCIQTLRDHKGEVIALMLLPDGRLVSGSGDNTIKIWDYKSGFLSCTQTLLGHTQRITALTMLSDQYIVSGSAEENTIKTWDITTGACLDTIPGCYSWNHGLITFQNRSLIYANKDNNIAIMPILSSLKPEEYAEYLAELSTITSIHRLNMQCIAVNNRELLNALYQFIINHQSITHIDLRNTGLTSENLKFLLPAIRQNFSLLEVQISESEIDLPLLRQLGHYLRRNNAKHGRTMGMASAALVPASQLSLTSSTSHTQDIHMFPSFTCPLTKKIMLEPVLTTAGSTYEREAIELHLETNDVDYVTQTKLASRQLITNSTLQRNIQLFLQQHPVFWEERRDELYCSDRLQAEFIAATHAGLVEPVRSILSQDQRLLTMQLCCSQHRLTAACSKFKIAQLTTPTSQNLLSLGCQQKSPKMLELILTRLDYRFWDCLGADEGRSLFKYTIRHMGTPGARLLISGGDSQGAEVLYIPCLGWGTTELQQQLYAYIAEDDVVLVQAALELLGYEIPDDQSNTSVHIAARDNKPEVLKFLISKEVSLMSPNKDGDTPLHLAVVNTHEPMIELLLQAGCRITIRNKQGQTPLEAAEVLGEGEIVRFVEQTKLKIDMGPYMAAMQRHYAQQELELRTELTALHSKLQARLKSMPGDPELVSISSQMQRLIEKLQSLPIPAPATLLQFDMHRRGSKDGTAEHKAELSHGRQDVADSQRSKVALVPKK